MSLERIIEAGSYTGNGTTQTITIGWQPALVIIASARTGGPQTGRALSYKMPNMAGDDVMCHNAAAEYLTANGVTITSTGFSVGSNQQINQSGITFHYVAFRTHPTIDTGTYTGNGGTQTITTGRQPTSMFVAQVSGTMRGFWKYSSHPTNIAAEFQTLLADVSALTLQSTGFQAEGNANASGETYVYVALYTGASSTINFECGSYTGNASDSQNVSLGRQPLFVQIDDTVGGMMATKSSSMSSGSIGDLEKNYDWVASTSVVIQSTGFQVWDLYNTEGNTYRYCAGLL